MLGPISEERVLSLIKEVTNRLGKELLCVVLFGSYVYKYREARDIDIIVVVNELKDLEEKMHLEVRLTHVLRSALAIPVDIIVFDLDSLKENLRPGTVLSGLVLGFRVLYDAVGFTRYFKELVKGLAQDDYVLYKKRSLRLSRLAKVMLKL
ncbi:MAG: hypothetical protein B6U73_04625 [Desulfurococcales archaeon ex4484_204]|nr:MAG: hypothetical protein B6U73_04625 [Desulfurococcales archaeon ex4484_204]